MNCLYTHPARIQSPLTEPLDPLPRDEGPDFSREQPFEVDGYDAVSGRAWSVVIKGVAREIKGLYEVIDAVELPIHTWHASPKPRLVRVDATEVTGRQFPRAEAALHPRSARRASPE